MLRSMCAADLGEAGDLTEAVGEKPQPRSLRLTQLACQLTAEKNSAVAEQQQQSEELADGRAAATASGSARAAAAGGNGEESEVDQEEEASDAVDKSDGEAALLSDDSGSVGEDEAEFLTRISAKEAEIAELEQEIRDLREAAKRLLLLPRLRLLPMRWINQSDDDGELCEQFAELGSLRSSNKTRTKDSTKAELAALLTRLEIAESKKLDERQLLTACVVTRLLLRLLLRLGGAQMDTEVETPQQRAAPQEKNRI
uniref:Fibrous sheath-interacting protein 1 n=1 Tax=Macrostomum lignano TaxID=282301 RepID=A0A1I8JRC8_9PLAT